MHPIRKRRLLLVGAGLLALFGASALMLTALNQNLQHFYSPSDILAGQAPEERRFRLGGLVREGSVSRDSQSLTVRFVVTDMFQTFPVSFNGILPDLFREGQSVVATGRLENGVFHADEVLAKHDENYMPKEVADAIARAKEKQASASDEGP